MLLILLANIPDSRDRKFVFFFPMLKEYPPIFTRQLTIYLYGVFNERNFYKNYLKIYTFFVKLPPLIALSGPLRPGWLARGTWREVWIRQVCQESSGDILCRGRSMAVVFPGCPTATPLNFLIHNVHKPLWAFGITLHTQIFIICNKNLNFYIICNERTHVIWSYIHFVSKKWWVELKTKIDYNKYFRLALLCCVCLWVKLLFD